MRFALLQEDHPVLAGSGLLAIFLSHSLISSINSLREELTFLLLNSNPQAGQFAKNELNTSPQLGHLCITPSYTVFL